MGYGHVIASFIQLLCSQVLNKIVMVTLIAPVLLLSLALSYAQKVNYLTKPNGKVAENLEPSSVIMNEIMEVIHKSQYPTDCSTRKLAVMQMKSTSFEGTGSLFKQILIGMAIAVHSERTLIWGLGLPYIFEHTQELWDGSNDKNIVFGEHILDCSNGELAGKGLGCFFEPITGCQLSDAKPAELVQFSHNTFNNSARLMIAEISKRGVSLFQPPKTLFGRILQTIEAKHGNSFVQRCQSFLAGREAHLWVSAIARYTFRLKTPLINVFSNNYKDLISEYSSSSTAAAASAGTDEVVWGVHVRHGDLRAMPHVYKYKTIFDFEDYFEAARVLSHQKAVTPDVLLVATDSIDVDTIDDTFQAYLSKLDAIEEEEDDELYDMDDEEDSTDCPDDADAECKLNENKKKISSAHKGFFGGRVPRLAAMKNNQRYRTAHGSHTVAANGGCLKDDNYDKKGMKCAMEYDAILQYVDHRSVPRSERIFRVLMESIEDIYQLSQTNTLIATGSSYFSTLASYLVWGNTGCKDVLNTVVYLDETAIEAGLTPTAHLHGMNLLNSTYGVDPLLYKDPGAERWKVHTKHFITGLPKMSSIATLFPVTYQSIAQHGPSFLRPWDKKYRMKIRNLLPYIHEPHFYHEAASWLGNQSYYPVWPGACPGLVYELNTSSNRGNKNSGKVYQDAEYYSSRLSEMVNLGVEHHTALNVGQAAQCWTDAETIINELRAAKAGGSLTINKNLFDEILDIVQGNLKSIRVHAYAELVIGEFSGNTNKFLKKQREMEHPLHAFKKRKTVTAGIVEHNIGDETAVTCALTEESVQRDLKRIEEINEEIFRLNEELRSLVKGIRSSKQNQ